MIEFSKRFPLWTLLFCFLYAGVAISQSPLSALQIFLVRLSCWHRAVLLFVFILEFDVLVTHLAVDLASTLMRLALGFAYHSLFVPTIANGL